MFKRTLSTVLAALLLTTLFGVHTTASASSKSDKRVRFAEKVRLNIAKLGVGNQAQVALKLRDKSKVAGYIREVSDESFVVVHPKFGTVTSVKYTEVAQVRGHNLSTGAKIAIGIAIGAGIVLVILLIYIKCCTG